MSETKKLSEEELAQINELKNLYGQIIANLGEIELQKEELTNALRDLDGKKMSNLSQMNELKDKETKLGQELSSKYGDGNINPSTGEFTPA